MGMRSLQRTLLLGAVTVSAATLMAACGGASTDEARDISTVATAVLTIPATVATTTTEPATTVAPTTIAPTTTAAVTTTLAPEPTTVVLPVPKPVPPPNEAEPVVEIGSIEIPKIGVNHPMFEGVTLPTLDHGPGHWPGTAEPGQTGNVVIGGHRVSHDKPFENLDQLVAGDEVIFNDGAGRHVYQVTSTEIVGPDAIWIIDQTESKTATLFACHPKGSTKQRIVTHLEFVETTV